MRRGVRSAGDGGADPDKPDKPEERLDCGNGVQAAAGVSCTEAGSRSDCAEGRANDYEANDYAEAAVSDCTTAADSNYAEAVDEYVYAAGHERTADWVADDCTGAVVCTCTDADAGHVYL